MKSATARTIDGMTHRLAPQRHAVAADALSAAMHWRYAVRRFSQQQVSAQDIHTLTEAVRMSPSAYGLQPYELLVVSSSELRVQLLAHSYGQDKIADCSHLMVFASYRDIDESLLDRYVALAAEARGLHVDELASYASQVRDALAALRTEQRAASAINQAFLALGTLVASAALLGIDCCPMSGFDAEGYDQVLGLSQQGLTAAVICAVGYRHPEDGTAHYPRVRVPRHDWLREY